MVKELNMVTCPKCKAENRPEAAFCSRCGTILFAQPAMVQAGVQPGESKLDTTIAQPRPVEQPMAPSSTKEASLPAETAPTKTLGFQAQPERTIFGNRFHYEALLSQEQHEVRYTVTETTQPENLSVQICSNPECRTIHCPVGEDPEKFCTQCGHSLEDRSLLFLLQESDLDQYSYIQHVLELHVVHPNIYPPVASFQQDINGGMRYYLVTPYTQNLPQQPEITEVLDWGIQLAGALDYLQTKGVVFSDELNLASIGLAENRAVWRSFNTVRILPMLTDREKINNLRKLCLAMYTMMTGQTSYNKDPYLPTAINNMFEKALMGEGFSSGADLIQQIDAAKESGLARLTLDYQVGRRSHPGKVRKVNEDSLLSVELSTYQQGGVLPFGIFAIADGMGGHAAGDVASSLVVNAIVEKVFDRGNIYTHLSSMNYTVWFNEIIQAANQEVFEARKKAGNDMGATLAFCLLAGANAYLTHEGDSRIYLINEESINQLTVDHSLVQHMITTGQITADEARYHPQRNVIYRSLGDKPYVEVESTLIQVFPHDRLLLCSDGLSSQIEDERIQKIVLNASSPQAACDQLVEAANATGGDDNISIVLIEIITV
jgi:PPM family protein phosphatase